MEEKNLGKQSQFDKTLSFEFFPPKTKVGADKLRNIATKLKKYNPAFYSVTYGAGGSNQDTTVETILDLNDHSQVSMAPHISCICSTKTSLRDMLSIYENHNVKRLVALRGDLPPGAVPSKEFHYATDLVAFIREATGDYFHIEVAAYPEFHPEAKNAKLDMMYFKQKIDAGANSAITQYFYNFDAYCRFIEACEAQGINIPIVPGIMPIHNTLQLERFSDQCGAELPRWIRKKLESMQDDQEEVLKFGIDIVTELCDKLIHVGAPGLHFYTLNRLDATVPICENLNLSSVNK